MMMMKLLQIDFTTITDWFNGGPVFNVVTILLAVAGFGLAIFFYFNPRKSYVITYTVRTIRLIKDGIENLKTLAITYDGGKIPIFTISKIALWNGGTECIDRNIIASKNTLKVKIDDEYEILGAEILYQKESSNDFKISIRDDKKIIDIEFEYFNKKEGVVLQIYHTGKVSDDIMLDGQIKSGKAINRISPSSSIFPILEFLFSSGNKTKKHKRKSKNSKLNLKQRYMVRFIFGWGIIIGCIITTIYGFNEVYSDDIPQPEKMNPTVFAIITILFDFLYINLGIGILQRRIPKGFDIFNEEFNEENVK